MSNISQIDPNFKVGSKIEKENIKFYNALEAPFKIYGVYMENGQFRRMPQAIAEQVNNGVARLHANTAGGRIRFKTNSSFVAISAKMPALGKMPHFAFSGSIGFDLYAKDENGLKYIKTFMPTVDITEGYESLLELGESKMREILIHFPTYSEVSELHIGLEDGAVLEAPEAYKYEKPFVCYGSSITQGGCASRSGNAYASLLSRWYDIDHINLGFSGSARAEDPIADYVAGLDMSFFLYDYDHNATSDEQYLNTHEKMFKKVRAAHPDIPILIMTRPRYNPDEVALSRKKIAYRTYENAIAAGDKRVWFMDGKQLMALCGDEGTVDNCHPTDLGFFSMAKAIANWIDTYKILELIEKV